MKQYEAMMCRTVFRKTAQRVAIVKGRWGGSALRCEVGGGVALVFETVVQAVRMLRTLGHDDHADTLRDAWLTAAVGQRGKLRQLMEDA